MNRTSLSTLFGILLLLQGCGLLGTSSQPPAEDSAPATEASEDMEATEVAPATSSTPEAEVSTPPEPEEAAEDPTPADTSSAVEKNTVREVSTVEILWQVPGEAVAYYHLRYGTEKNALNKKAKVAVRDLEKVDHPDHGSLYRYVLPGVPAEKTVYFTIQAENQFGLSPESPVQQVDTP